jgi:hypothetical protein
MNQPLTAHAFSEPLHTERSSNGEPELRFNISGDNAATVLRQFADAIERKEVYIQSAVTYQKASQEDFTVSAMVLKFAQKLPPVATAKS